MATLLTLRARGAMTPAILVVSTPEAYPREELRRLGDPVVVSLADLPTSLPNAIERALRLNAATAASRQLVPLLRSLSESQRLIAAGRIARRVKHDINNPLAALLGEAQLLELEPLAPEQLEAVQRIVELCGRIVALARELDGPSPTSP
jgi:signal transduction histidine kinase